MIGRQFATLPAMLAGGGTYIGANWVKEVVQEQELDEAMGEAEARLINMDKVGTDWVEDPGGWVGDVLPHVPVVVAMGSTWLGLSRRYGGRSQVVNLFKGKPLPRSVIFRPAATTTITTLFVTTGLLTHYGVTATKHGDRIPLEHVAAVWGLLFASSLFTAGLLLFPYYTLCNIIGAAGCRHGLLSMRLRVATRAKPFGT